MLYRLFLLYVVVELAVIVALTATIGFGWTILLLLGMFVLGVALAGSEGRRHFDRLQAAVRGAVGPTLAIDSWLVPIGVGLVVIPGLASTLLGALLLLPPTRAAIRPLATSIAARALQRADVVVTVNAGHGDYIDGEVISVVDDEPTPMEYKPLY